MSSAPMANDSDTAEMKEAKVSDDVTEEHVVGGNDCDREKPAEDVDPKFCSPQPALIANGDPSSEATGLNFDSVRSSIHDGPCVLTNGARMFCAPMPLPASAATSLRFGDSIPRTLSDKDEPGAAPAAEFAATQLSPPSQHKKGANIANNAKPPVSAPDSVPDGVEAGGISIPKVGSEPTRRACVACRNSNIEKAMIECVDCKKWTHRFCLNPPLEYPPRYAWRCLSCLRKRASSYKSRSHGIQTADRVSTYIEDEERGWLPLKLRFKPRLAAALPPKPRHRTLPSPVAKPPSTFGKPLTLDNGAVVPLVIAVGGENWSWSDSEEGNAIDEEGYKGAFDIDIPPGMVACEHCEMPHDGSFGSGRFCSAVCSRAVGGLNRRRGHADAPNAEGETSRVEEGTLGGPSGAVRGGRGGRGTRGRRGGRGRGRGRGNGRGGGRSSGTTHPLSPESLEEVHEGTPTKPSGGPTRSGRVVAVTSYADVDERDGEDEERDRVFSRGEGKAVGLDKDVAVSPSPAKGRKRRRVPNQVGENETTASNQNGKGKAAKSGAKAGAAKPAKPGKGYKLCHQCNRVVANRRFVCEHCGADNPSSKIKRPRVTVNGTVDSQAPPKSKKSLDTTSNVKTGTGHRGKRSLSATVAKEPSDSGSNEGESQFEHRPVYELPASDTNLFAKNEPGGYGEDTPSESSDGDQGATNNEVENSGEEEGDVVEEGGGGEEADEVVPDSKPKLVDQRKPLQAGS